MGDVMKHGSDFSWNTNKPILDHNVDRIIPIPPEPVIGTAMNDALNVDQNEEINQLIDTFKHRLSDIISREEEK